MADCFIKRYKTDTKFITNGITGIFDTDTLDISNSLWLNQIKNDNNISLSGTFSQSQDFGFNALTISGLGYGEYISTIQPSTYYVVARAVTTGYNWSAFIGKKLGISGYGGKYDYCIYFNTNSSTPQPLCREDGIGTSKVVAPCDEYHVICRCNGAFIVDGEILSQSRDVSTEYYSGAMELHRLWRASWTSGSWTANYLFVAFGNTDHTIEQALKNSKYLMKKYNIK